jgi:hypothetical protein
MPEGSPKSIRQRATLDARVHELTNRFESVRHLPIEKENRSVRMASHIDSMPAPFPKMPSQAKLMTIPSESGMNKEARASRWLPLKRNLSLIIDISKRADSSSSIINEPKIDIPSDNTEETDLESYWKNFQIPSATIDDVDISGLQTPSIADYQEELDQTIEESGLTISKIPESIINEQRARKEETLIRERQIAIDRIKAKEIDVLWREHQARERLITEEKKNLDKLGQERAAVIDLAVEKHRAMEKDFKAAREDLEQYLKQQKARIQDKFGQVSFSDSVSSPVSSSLMIILECLTHR